MDRSITDDDIVTSRTSRTHQNSKEEASSVLSIITEIQRVSLPALSVNCFSFAEQTTVTEIPLEMISEHELLFVMEGSVSYLIGGKVFTAEAGDCLYCAPGELRGRMENHTPASFLVLSFWNTTPAENNFPDVLFPHRMPYDSDSDVRSTVGQLVRICQTGSPDQRKKCLAALQLLLIQLEDFILLYSDNDYVRTMKHYILDHYREGVQLADLAENVGLHPVYCAKIFKRSEGITVGEFINQLRISRAAAQLESAAETSDVAEDLGLSEFYFSRWFRQMTGLTPTEYRDTLRSRS